MRLINAPLPSPFRALEVWGSWQVLEHELNRRRVEEEEVEKRRQGGYEASPHAVSLLGLCSAYTATDSQSKSRTQTYM